MSTFEMITLAAMLLASGGVASFLVQKLKRAAWSSRTKYVLALALSATVGLATSWLAGDVLGIIAAWGDLTAAQVFAFLGAVYATATGFYELWFKNAIAPRE